MDNLDKLLLFLRIVRIDQQRGKTDNGIQRSPDLMAHIGKECRFQTVEFFGFLTQLLRFLQFGYIIIHTDHFKSVRISRLGVPHYIHTSPMPTFSILHP